MALSPLRSLGSWELVRYEVFEGFPTVARVLRRHLGLRATVRVLAAMAVRGRADPLAGIDRAWPEEQERPTRRQLAPVFLMDDALRDLLGMDLDERTAILEDVVAEAGARFVARNAVAPDRDRWDRAPEGERLEFVRALTRRLFNTRVANVEVGDASLSFDVTACRLAELCRAAGREYLAPLFCEADSRYFADPAAPVELSRAGTIARGATRCDFRFRYRSR